MAFVIVVVTLLTIDPLGETVNGSVVLKLSSVVVLGGVAEDALYCVVSFEVGDKGPAVVKL